MLLNGSVLNGSPLNGAGAAAAPEETIVASGIAIEIEQSVESLPASGVAIEIEQTVGIIASGVSVQFEQIVFFSNTSSGIAIQFEQDVTVVADGVAVEISQRVRNNTAASHLERFGWDARVTINGALIPQCSIAGPIVVQKTENSATIASIELVNQSGLQDFDRYHGKSILIDADVAAGTKRIFTGVVDVPEVDLVNKRILLRCTDRREERVNSGAAGSQIKYIGQWSEEIFQEADTLSEELEQRLQTVPEAVDFDSYGVFRRTSILPKAKPDFTLQRCDISINAPRVKIAARARLINRVKVEVEARWVRLRERRKSFEINTPTFCEYMTIPGLDYLRVDTVYRTLDSFGWAVNLNEDNFEYLPPAGVYNCGNGKFIWSPIETSGTVQVVRDANGNQVTDANGNPVTELVNETATNLTQVFCMGRPAVTWQSAKRWAQDISGKINVTLSAPQSINQYGVIDRTNRYGYEVEFDTSDFEESNPYQNSQTFIDGGNGDYYRDESGNPAVYKKALQTAFSIAETSIIRSHRDNEVSFKSRNFWPDVELYHTVAINTDTVSCRGKVIAINHRLDASNKTAETEVTLSLSRAQGSQSPDSLSFPLLDAPLLGEPGGDITFELYKQNIGFTKTPPEKQPTLTAPGIEDIARNRQETVDNYTYDVVIQNDPLEVNF